MAGATDRPFVNPAYQESETTAQIIAAALTVHRTLGPGFEEVFYQRALALELPGFGLEFAREVWIDVRYHEHLLGRKRVDFVIADVLLEIKARALLEPVHYVQTLSYLKASGYKIGLLINFGAARLEIKRLAH
jgi:GxxExxY protein